MMIELQHTTPFRIKKRVEIELIVDGTQNLRKETTRQKQSKSESPTREFEQTRAPSEGAFE